MMYVNTDSGELLDTTTVYNDLKVHMNQVDNIYRQLRFHNILTDDLHQRAFYNAVDLLNYIIYDIKERVEVSDGIMLAPKKRRPLSEFSKQLDLVKKV